MHVGHFAVGFLAKRVEPKLSLGTLVLAAMLADFLWCVLMLAGVEHVQFKPGRGAGNYFEAHDIAISHSLLTDMIWAALFAGAYFAVRRYRRGSWVLFAVVISHWPLDVVAHRPDMPLAPGVQKYFGLGLWTNVPATLMVEGGFWLLAVILYVRVTSPEKRLGVYLFWVVAALLTLIWYNNIAGPPPPDPRTAPVFSLAYFSLVVVWAYWMNRLRPAGSGLKKD